MSVKQKQKEINIMLISIDHGKYHNAIQKCGMDEFDIGM